MRPLLCGHGVNAFDAGGMINKLQSPVGRTLEKFSCFFSQRQMSYVSIEDTCLLLNISIVQKIMTPYGYPATLWCLHSKYVTFPWEGPLLIPLYNMTITFDAACHFLHRRYNAMSWCIWSYFLMTAYPSDVSTEARTNSGSRDSYFWC